MAGDLTKPIRVEGPPGRLGGESGKGRWTKPFPSGPRLPGGKVTMPPRLKGPGGDPGFSVSPPDWASMLEGDQRDAFVALNSLFRSYGLGTLAPKIFEYIKNGESADTISLLLQDTKEYKTRFAGNEARKKAGLAVLNPAEYLATEAAYRQILSSAGMPKGFYDQTSDFANWIGTDVSPTEIKGRVDMALEYTTQANDAAKQALKAMYGVSEADVAAYFLDQKRAEPLLKKQAAAADIGAAALQRGFALDKSYFEQFATEGVTGDQARQGFAVLADTFESVQAIARRYGEDFTQREAMRDVFEQGKTPTPGNQGSYLTESPTEKRKRLASQERALFAGQQGSSAMGLGNIYRST